MAQGAPEDLRAALAAVCALAACFLGATLLACSGPAARRPNIVLVMSDDQGWSEVGYYDHPHLATPVLDEMAASGLRFDRFYAAAPVCSPTRASVLTGRHPNRSGVLSWQYALRPEEIGLASLLRRAGYRTGHFGKWHLGPVAAASPVNPRAFGFDEYLSHDKSFDIDPILSRNGAPHAVVRGEGSQIIADAAIDFLVAAHSAGQPFFAVLWFGSPHAPYQATREDLDGYAGLDGEQRGRYAEITAMDRALGSVRDAIDMLGLRKDTLIWFCSDNGVPTAFEGTSGLRGGKGYLTEGGIRVPGILEWPGKIERPIATATPAVTSDIFPTLLDLVGIDPPDRPLDGVSLRRLIEGGELERPPIGFWVYPAASEAKNDPWLDPRRLLGTSALDASPRLQFLNFRHATARTSDFPGNAAWLDGPWKLLVVGAPGAGGEAAVHLFDLEDDPGETKDVAALHPERVEDMSRSLRRWQAAVEQSLTGADYGRRRGGD